MVGLTHADIDPATIPRPVRPAGCGPGPGAAPASAPARGASCWTLSAAGAPGGGVALAAGSDFTPNPDAGSWIHDAKYYQFFNDGTEDGKFTITKVRPGKYTLHATADGVLGDFAQANITVEPGKTARPGQAGLEAGALRQAGVGDWLSGSRGR